jgi:hypothetical protein
MFSIEDKIRALIANIRRRPIPIADIIPLLSEAADEIARLRAIQFMYESVIK